MLPITTLVIVWFSLCLFIVGANLLKITSFKKALELFETNQHPKTWFNKWFLGWQWKLERNLTRSAINTFGDTLVTRFYRLTGVFFILVAILSLTFPLLKKILNWAPSI